MGVLVSVAMRSTQGGVTGFNSGGTWAAMTAGILGALGAVGIILVFRAGGTHHVVMPLVFGGAPIVGTLFAMSVSPPRHDPSLIWHG